MSVDLTIIIINYNTAKLTNECIASVVKYTKDISYEIILIDNASTEKITVPSEVKYVKNDLNLGFAGANNQGIKLAKGKYILFLNSDTYLTEDSLSKMVRWMDERPKAGAVSCTLLYDNKKLQINGGGFPDLFKIFTWASFLDDIPGFANLFGSYHATVEIPISNNIYKKEHEQDWISGAVFMIRKEVVEQAGGFDSDIFMYGEDVEYSYRIRKAGWEVWFLPITRIVHYGSASSSGDMVNFIGSTIGKKNAIVNEFRGLQEFYKKHYPKWQIPVLSFTLKFAAICRIFIFGIIGRQGSAIKIYAEAFKVA